MVKKRKKFDKRLIILGFLILILMMILKSTILIPFLIITSISVSFIINNFPIRNIGIELATFVGVIIGRHYGAMWGFISCGVLIMFHLIAGGFFGMYVFWVIPSYAIGGALGGIFGGSIITVGTIASIFINVVEGIFTAILTPAQMTRHIPYAITNVIFNVILFTILGNAILFLL